MMAERMPGRVEKGSRIKPSLSVLKRRPSTHIEASVSGAKLLSKTVIACPAAVT